MDWHNFGTLASIVTVILSLVGGVVAYGMLKQSVAVNTADISMIKEELREHKETSQRIFVERDRVDRIEDRHDKGMQDLRLTIERGFANLNDRFDRIQQGLLEK